MAERDDVNDNTATRTAEQIRRDIAAKRETISNTVDSLGVRIQEKLDWRGYVARYPYATLGAAAGLGFAAAFMLGRKRRNPFERVVDAVTDSIEDAGDQVRSALQGVVTRVGGRGLVKGTLYGLAGKLAMNWLRNAASEALHRGGYEEGTAEEVTGAPWSARTKPQSSSPRPV